MLKDGWTRPGLISLAAAMILLPACATKPSDLPQAPVLICPRVVEYSDEVLNRAANEVEALPVDSQLVVLLSDYGEMRARARACREARQDG